MTSLMLSMAAVFLVAVDQSDVLPHDLLIIARLMLP
jgi:hypothetical protein